MRSHLYEGKGKVEFSEKGCIGYGYIKAIFTESGIFKIECILDQIIEKSVKINPRSYFLRDNHLHYSPCKLISLDVENGECLCEGILLYTLKLEDNYVHLIFLNVDKFHYKSRMYDRPEKLHVSLTNFIFPENSVFNSDKDTPPNNIEFSYKNLKCSVQPIDEYYEIQNKLKNHEIPRAVTAMMEYKLPLNQEGNIESGEFKFSDFILYLLSIVVGNKVGAAWIERIDNTGNIVIRDHIKWGNHCYQEGFPLINPLLNDSTANIGNIVRLSFESHFSFDKRIKIILKNLMTIGLHDTQLENKLDLIIRSFDILIKMFEKTNKANNNNNSKAICIGKILTDHEIHDKIGKIKMPGGWGNNIITIVRELGFLDADLMDTLFKKFHLLIDKKSYDNWGALLNYIRGCIMHEGFLDDLVKIRIIENITRHLHDILFRIILVILGYKSTYNSPLSLEPVLVDRLPQIELFGKRIALKKVESSKK